MNDRVLRALLRVALHHPRAVLVGWALFAVALTPWALQLEISTSTESVLDRQGAEWAYYQHSVDTFGGDEVVVVALEGREEFDPDLLRRLSRLGDELEALPGVRRVDSLATVPLIRSEPDGQLDLRPALAGGVPTSAAELAVLSSQVATDRIAPGSLISRDLRVVALNVLLDADLGTSFEEVVQGVRRVVSGYGGWISGVPVFRAEVNRRAGLEIARFVVVTVLLVSIVLLLALRSAVALMLALFVGAIGTWSTVAALGATGTPLSLATVILPSIMLALGCAYSMHLLAAARGAGTREELRAALEPVLAPTALSGLTTVIGFVAIAAVRIQAIRDVGAFGALGVFIVAGACLSVVPAGLAVWPLRDSGHRWLRWIAGVFSEKILVLAVDRATAVLITSCALVGVFAVGLSRMQVETDVTRWFPRGSEVRDSYETIRERLSGISPINIVVDSNGAGLTSPEALHAIADLAAYLESLQEVGKALSVAAPIRQLHAGFTGDTTGALPDSRELIEQYLLLLGSVDYLDDLLTVDHSAANIVLRVDHNGSQHLLEVADKAEQWWLENGVPGTQARATGIMYEFARAEDEISYGQLRGLSFAFAAVFVLLFAIYRQARIAILAIVPNVLPLIVVFGFLGLAGIELDAGIVVAGCLVLGVAVDDTIHTVSAWEEARRAGLSGAEALRAALARVLVPVVLTTLVVGVGFAALALSSFSFVRNLGLLVSAVMAICFLADLVLLPALLVRYGPAPGR